MQQPEVIWFPSSDGEHPCAGYLWQPQGQIRGVVQIVHGIAEHMGRYDHFARYLNAHGYVVCGEDHLGHGKTGEAAGQFGFLAAGTAGHWPRTTCARSGNSWERSSQASPISCWATPWAPF